MAAGIVAEADITAEAECTVFIVEDDPSVRDVLELLIGEIRVATRSFDSGAAFLREFERDSVGCVILDVRLPDMSGLRVLDELADTGIPVVVITAHADVKMAVEAMKRGALDFLEKPFNAQNLLDVVQRAIGSDRTRVKRQLEHRTVFQRLNTLTSRERLVVDHIVSGLTTKEIASELAVSTQAIDKHRARAMAKLQVGSVAALVSAIALVTDA